MKLVLHTLMIFSLTLAAAGVVALQVPLEDALPPLLQQAATATLADDR
jgi:hypothetical protein